MLFKQIITAQAQASVSDLSISCALLSWTWKACIYAKNLSADKLANQKWKRHEEKKINTRGTRQKHGHRQNRQEITAQSSRGLGIFDSWFPLSSTVCNPFLWELKAKTLQGQRFPTSTVEQYVHPKLRLQALYYCFTCTSTSVHSLYEWQTVKFQLLKWHFTSCNVSCCRRSIWCKIKCAKFGYVLDVLRLQKWIRMQPFHKSKTHTGSYLIYFK